MPDGKTEIEPHHVRCIVPAAAEDARVDRFLAERYPAYSRARIQRAAQAGALLVDGRPVRSNHRLQSGATVELTLVPFEPNAPPAAEAIDLEIVFEDDQLVVVNKPAGMVVHPAAGHRSGTLVNALLGRGLLSEGASTAAADRPGIVHRLDKGTSGLLVVARTESAHRHLAEQLKSRTLSRTYWAVCWGHLKSSTEVFSGSVGRSLSDRKRMTVTARGRTARSTARVLERFGLADLVEVALDTGRTHQIRVHLSHAGHPLVGDADYGGDDRHLRGIDPKLRSLGRQMLAVMARPALQARALSLAHPVTGQRLSWTVEPPADFADLLALCRAQPT